MDTPSKNFPFRQWCAAKSFTPKHGYKLIEDGLLETFVLYGRRYVSAEADERFDAATRSNSAVVPIPHRPEVESARKRSERRNAEADVA